MTTHTASSRKMIPALLVDDDKFMLTVLTDMLRELGIGPIATATDGHSAAETFARTHPSLVVCDLKMPGNDGFQFMEHLGEKGFNGGIVLVSGMDSTTMNSASLMAKFHRLNILATLPKPVAQDALAAALSDWRYRH